jgi:hypothetical protein
MIVARQTLQKNQRGTEVSTTKISHRTRWRLKPTKSKQNKRKIKPTKYNRKIHENTET